MVRDEDIRFMTPGAAEELSMNDSGKGWETVVRRFHDATALSKNNSDLVQRLLAQKLVLETA